LNSETKGEIFVNFTDDGDLYEKLDRREICKADE
jgi:hypothetical protein